MKRRILIVALSAMTTTGCAALFSRDEGPDPREQLVAGAQALTAQEYMRARGLLEPIYHERWQEPIGQQALLMLITAELDPRNPDRRLWAGADRSARMLNIAELPTWMVPVAESLYGLANELGAQEQLLERADSARSAAERRAVTATNASGRQLPRTTTESVLVRERRLTQERDAARRQYEQAQQTLTAREKELRETKQELERIKRTIRS